VERARSALGLNNTPVTHASREDLFELSLEQLRVPGALASGAVHCRHALADEVPRLIAWRVAYKWEAMGQRDDGSAAVEVERARQEGTDWVLEAAGEPVAFSTFNAQLPDVVQVGGVWTPPELRGRGYARGVVAGSLLEAQSGGAFQAILFTAVDNHPARRAYLALGFKIIGDYGVVMLAPG
jgi:predicted GNAT family acetyltransferase